MNQVLEAIAKRSSTRSYTSEKLTEEEIKILVDAALQSPTATNKQEIHVTVLDGDSPKLAKLEQAKREFFAAKATDPETKEKILNAKTNFYYNAPTVLLLSGPEAFSWSSMDAGIASQSICLAAQSLGLGSVILGIVYGVFSGETKEEYKKLFEIKEEDNFLVCVAVGHIEKTKEPHTYVAENQVTYLD